MWLWARKKAGEALNLGDRVQRLEDWRAIKEIQDKAHERLLLELMESVRRISTRMMETQRQQQSIDQKLDMVLALLQPKVQVG
jgi:hypothetical protein